MIHERKRNEIKDIYVRK